MILHREDLCYSFLKGKGKVWDVWMFYRGDKMKKISEAGHYSQAERLARSMNKHNFEEIAAGNLVYEEEVYVGK